MTYAFIKYWLEGTKEAVHQLCEAIEKADGYAVNAIKNLGLDAERFETDRVEWLSAKAEDKDGYSVISFEEYYPYERGTLIDQLMDEALFKGKLTALYYYAEEMANAHLCETNDAEGKYWPYRLMISMEPVTDEEGHSWLYAKDETEAVQKLHKHYIPAELNSLEAIKQYVDEKLGEEGLWITPIKVVSIEEAQKRFSVRDFDYDFDLEHGKVTATLKEESKWKAEGKQQ